MTMMMMLASVMSVSVAIILISTASREEFYIGRLDHSRFPPRTSRMRERAPAIVSDATNRHTPAVMMITATTRSESTTSVSAAAFTSECPSCESYQVAPHNVPESEGT